MSTDALAADWRLDSPWRRLPWTLPGAVLAGALILGVLATFMRQPPPRPPEPPPIDAQVIELPPPPPPAPPAKPEPRVEALPKPSPRPVQMPVPVHTETAPPAPAAPAATPSPPLPTPPAPPTPPRSTNSGLSGNSGAQAIVRPMPQIPDDLRDDALDDAAVARFHVAVDGSATVELSKPTPNPSLNHLLLNTLKNWHFFPAMKDGKPVPSVEEIVIRIQVK
jgi:protein TonB